MVLHRNPRGALARSTPTGQPISGTVFSFFELVEGAISRYRVWMLADVGERIVFDSSRPVLP